MAFPHTIAQRLLTLLLLTCLLTQSTFGQSCNTNLNKSCAGNAQFEAICCPPGNICYWSSRKGDPACCVGGTDCRGDGGPGPITTTIITTTPIITTTSRITTTSCTTTTSITPIPITTTSPTSYWYSWTSTYTTPYITSFSTVSTPGAVVVTVTETQGLATTAQPNGVVVTVLAVSGAKSLYNWSSINWLLGSSIATCLLMTTVL